MGSFNKIKLQYNKIQYFIFYNFFDQFKNSGNLDLYSFEIYYY